MTRDTYDRFQPPDRGRFGDNELSPDSQRVEKLTGDRKLITLDLLCHNDNPTKRAIAVSNKANTPFEKWSWLPRSLVEYESIGEGVGSCACVKVTLPERLAKEKGLI